MPTGYTAAIKDGITFEQFALRCSRSMGALIDMRDAPMDAPIPDRFEPSSHYMDKLKETQAELSRLHSLSPDQAEGEAKRYHAEELASIRVQIDDANDLRTKYTAMLAQVMLWQPPTPDHQHFREFMIKQIEESLRFDCDVSYLGALQPTRRTGEEYRSINVLGALERVTYYQTQHAEEVARTAERNNWLKALRDSLPKSI